MIHLIEDTASVKELKEMQEEHRTYIKVAVDVGQDILAGGGIWHDDGKRVLLEKGSNSDDVWGASYYPLGKRVVFKSMINIRPQDSNPGREIVNQERRALIEKIIRSRLES